MIKIGIVGDIGSGKSYVARQFKCSVFDADLEVSKIYKKSRICHKKLKDKLPNYISSFPTKKKEISRAILDNSPPIAEPPMPHINTELIFLFLISLKLLEYFFRQSSTIENDSLIWDPKEDIESKILLISKSFFNLLKSALIIF